MAKKRKKKQAAEASPSKRRWPAVRAAIICFFIVFNVLAAIPSPGNVTHYKLRTKTNQAELRRWVKILGGFGIETNEKDLGDWYVRFAADVEGVRHTVLKPIDAWMRWTMTTQGWRLFGMPDERPFRLKIVVRTGAEEKLLYRSSDPDHRWNAGLFQFRRVRGMYNPGNLHAPGTYEGFAKRVSELVFAEHPDADEVIVSLPQEHTTLPGEPPDPRVEERYIQRFPRPKAGAP